MPNPVILTAPIEILDTEGKRILSKNGGAALVDELNDFRVSMEEESRLPTGDAVFAHLEARRDKRPAPGPQTLSDIVAEVIACREQALRKSPHHADLVGMTVDCFPMAHEGTPPKVTTKVISLRLEWTASGISLLGFKEAAVKGADAVRHEFSHPLRVVKAILGTMLRENIGTLELRDGRSIYLSDALVQAADPDVVASGDAVMMRLVGELERHTRRWPDDAVPKREVLSDDEIVVILKLAEDLEQQAARLRGSLKAAIGEGRLDDIHDPHRL